MSTKLKNRPKPREVKRSEALGSSNTHKLTGLHKNAVSLKVTEDEATSGSVMEPTEEQLARINQFTRSTKSSSDLVVFKTYSCNDMYDRDEERFTPDCVNDFAKLEQPYSPIGKSFMVGHDYSKLPVGRVFGADVETVSGVKFLTNEVYLPNIDSNKSFIENIDHGIYWAVSVGVVVDNADCSICKEQVYRSWFGDFCLSGHEKGYYYVPGDEDEDAWGFLVPVDPSTKGAVQAKTDLSNPRDFYELSMVFLGAQYMAELGKQPSFKKIMKTAAVGGVPIVGLSAKEAPTIPLPTVPEKVAEAREKYEITTQEDGSSSWVDDDGLVWNYVPSEGEVFCLGKSQEDDEETEEEDEEEPTTTTDETVDEDEDTDEDEDEDEDNDEDEDTVTTTATPAADPTPVSGDEVASQVLAVAKKIKFPAALTSAVATSADTTLRGVMVAMRDAYNELESASKGLEDLAEVGRGRLKELRSDVISWYVKANQTDQGARVSTKVIEKMLDRVGDDPEILQQLIEDNKSVAQSRFPKSVRRSSFEQDANEPPKPNDVDIENKQEDRTVSRIHNG